MEESSTLKLVIEKGPREGETLEYSSRSVVKIGRVVRGNTIGIKDAGISSKHISIQFDNQLSKWNLTDLDSCNGTILNGEVLLPGVPSALKDGDCIKIGEMTSIIVKIGGVQSTIGAQRNTRSRGKAAAVYVVEREQNEFELGLDGDLGKKEAEEPVPKRNLRPRAKKAVDSKNDVESLNSKRTLRSSKKEEKVSSVSTLNQIPEDTNLDVRKRVDQIVPIERKVTRGRTKKLPAKDPDSDKEKPAEIVVPVDGKKTRRGRKQLPVEPLQESQTSESVRVDAANNLVENSALEENLYTNNESAQDHIVEKLVSTQEGDEEQEAMVDQSLVKGSSEAALQVHVDKGNELPDGCEGSVKETGVDTSRWQDLEKMTLGDFFDYLEWYLPKEIREKTEEIISSLPEKTKKFHEARLQNEKGKSSKQAKD